MGVVKVNCSFCGKEMECPKHMLKKIGSHMCFECLNNVENIQDKNKFEEDVKAGRIHIDIPTSEMKKHLPEIFAEQMTEQVFDKLWEEREKEVKNLDRKNLAKEMFSEGIFNAIYNLFENPEFNGKFDLNEIFKEREINL